MTFRVTTTDIQFPNVLQNFKDDLTRLRAQFETELTTLKTLNVQISDEPVEDMRTNPDGSGVPRTIQKDPLDPIDVFSETQGKGIKYRPEPDGAFIINNSAVCYMFDEFQVADRNVSTAEVSSAGVNSALAQSLGVTELPYVPPTPKWEIPAAQIEAGKVDHDVRQVRDILDQPFPLPPLTTDVPVGFNIPLFTGGVPVPLFAFVEPSDHKKITLQSPLTGFTSGPEPLAPGDTILLGIPTSVLGVPTPTAALPAINLSFTAVIDSLTDTQLTLVDDFPYVQSPIISGPQPPFGIPPVTIPPPPLPIFKHTIVTVPLPVPPSAIVQSLTATFNSLTVAANNIEPVVTPLTPLLNFKDKTDTGFDANIIGVPPIPLLPNDLPSPFGKGKGRRFIPGSLGGVIQIEALVEGPPTKTLLRQGPGPDMCLSAVIRPDQAPPGRGWTIASNSSPIPAIPFATTNYSLQLVEANGYLFPRLTWQYFDLGVLATGTAQSDSKVYASTYGALAAIGNPEGAAAQALLPPESIARRTAYAQSFVPLPLPRNDAYGYPASKPPTLPGIPLNSRFFVGVTRWKRELSLQSVPFFPFPLVPPYVSLQPNFDGILKNPALALEPVRLGDYVTFGNDSPSYFTNSYELWQPYGGVAAPVSGEILGGPILIWPPFYMGNPPTVFPFPKGKKLYSVGVTFYIGDLETGNYFIDDFPLYGTDEFGIGHGSTFKPGHNTNLPFPINGELSDFYIGADLQTPFYGPSFGLNGGVNAAGLAASMNLDVYSIITAGHAGAVIPAPAPSPLPVYSGDYYMLNIPTSKGSTKQERDKVMTDQFNACFPDYTRDGKVLTRSPRSQIPNGGTVYVNYKTETDLPEAETDSTVIKATIDALLNASSNPATNTTDTVAAAVGVPLPNPDPNATELSLEPALHLVDGRPYLPGNTPVGCFKRLVDIVGYDIAVSLCVGKPNSPVLVISIQDRFENPAVDSCGNSFTSITLVERILGIDISTQEALRLAGVEDYGLLILRLFWIGGLQLPTFEVQNKLDSFQLAPTEKSAALMGESNGMIEVCEIPDQNLVTKLKGTPDDIRKLFTDRNPTNLNVAPTSAEMREAILGVISAAAPATTDGNIGPVPPFINLFNVLDMAKAFDLTPTDLSEVDAGFAANATVSDLCRTLFAGVSACIGNADLSMHSYQNALAPALRLLNFNVGMARLNAETYVLCLGNFTPSMASVAPGLAGLLATNPFALPGPRELLDPLRNTVTHLATMSEKALATLNPIRTLNSQLPVIGSAISSVSNQAHNILCVPRSMVEALQGGVCGIAIPPAVVSACVTGNDQFQTVIQHVKDYSLTAAAMVNQATQSFLGLKDTMESTNDACKQLNTDMTSCLNQISGFVNGIVSASQSPAVAEAMAITSGGI